MKNFFAQYISTDNRQYKTDNKQYKTENRQYKTDNKLVEGLKMTLTFDKQCSPEMFQDTKALD